MLPFGAHASLRMDTTYRSQLHGSNAGASGGGGSAESSRQRAGILAGGWAAMAGYVLLSKQRARSTSATPLLGVSDELSGMMRTVPKAETGGRADGTAAGNADTCFRYTHGEDSHLHGAHALPTHQRMPVSIGAPHAHGCASAASHGAGTSVRRAHAHGVYLPRSAVQCSTVPTGAAPDARTTKRNAHVCVSAKCCMTSASLSMRRQRMSSSYARAFPGA